MGREEGNANECLHFEKNKRRNHMRVFKNGLRIATQKIGFQANMAMPTPISAIKILMLHKTQCLKNHWKILILQAK